VSSVQMLWSSAGRDGMMAVGGAQPTLKSPFMAFLTMVRSSCATPKDAADMATCSMKYPTSAAERSMNL
jgi:hypothetical protein